MDFEDEVLLVPVGLPDPERDIEELAVGVLEAGCDRVPVEDPDTDLEAVILLEVLADLVGVLEVVVELVGLELRELLRVTEELPVPLRDPEGVLESVAEREPDADFVGVLELVVEELIVLEGGADFDPEVEEVPVRDPVVVRLTVLDAVVVRVRVVLRVPVKV